MRVTPRPDQWRFIAEIHQQWSQGARAVLGVASTGFGKTVCLGQLVNDHPGASCVIAHRQELVGQISQTLARYGVRHHVIAADNTRRAIAANHVIEFGACYLSPSAPCAVASIDTLTRAEGLESWAATVTLAIVDEGHHVVEDNKWHKGIARFTNAAVRFLLPTATPERADGKGLGKPAIGGSGIADCMVHAPPMRWLIDNGHLTDYRVVCVESDLRALTEAVEVGASGDWSTQKLKDASERSQIVGDVVREYLRWAPGKRHITFTTDIETAGKMTAKYREAGVRAECLTGKTRDDFRRDMIRRFEAGQLDEIVAVDIISEGFDLPAIEAISMARPSKSLAVVWQQFGRACRTLPGKKEALIIDHVGNLLNPAIGLPDRPRKWSLANRTSRRKASDGGIPMRVCLQCFAPYERIHKACPYCGHYEPPGGRTSPAEVDGDLAEMSPELLARLRSAADEAVMPIEDWRAKMTLTGLPDMMVKAQVNRHAERLDTLAALREAMAIWGGRRKAEGLSDSQMQRLFYLRFGMDVLTAQSLKREPAQNLIDAIVNSD